MADRRIERRRRAHIPDDLLMEILSRLPTRSLCRFRCISRSWATFISQRRTFLPMSGLYFKYTEFLPEHPLHIYVSFGGEQVEGCRLIEFCARTLSSFSSSPVVHGCNGIFLFLNVGPRPLRQLNYSVCNPATMEGVALPKCPRSTLGHSFLAYDPRESPHYKVLRFMEAELGGMMVDIYSSMTGEWVEHMLPSPQRSNIWSGAAYLHGALYILNIQGSHLLRFDVERTCFQVLMLPKGPTPGTRFTTTRCIGISRGHPDSEVLYLSILDKVFSYYPDGERLEKVCKIAYMINPIEWTSTFVVTPSLESINPPGSTIFRWMQSPSEH